MGLFETTPGGGEERRPEGIVCGHYHSRRDEETAGQRLNGGGGVVKGPGVWPFSFHFCRPEVRIIADWSRQFIAIEPDEQ